MNRGRVLVVGTTPGRAIIREIYASKKREKDSTRFLIDEHGTSKIYSREEKKEGGVGGQRKFSWMTAIIKPTISSYQIRDIA